MEKIWLKNYPPGVPAEIDYSGYSSLAQLLEESFAKYRERTAYICMGKGMTYAQLDERSRNFGAWLQSRGLKKGARVAVMLPNVLQNPVSVMGVLRAGCIVVNVNPLYTPRELEHQLKDSGAEAIVVLENFAVTLQAVIARTAVKHVVVATMGDLLGLKGVIVNFVVRKIKKMVPPYNLPGAHAFNAVLAEGAGEKQTPVAMTPDDVAFLQYTGGTTGVSKGATLSNRNLIANLIQAETWNTPVTSRYQGQLNFVCALPLYHIYALTVCCLMGARIGGCNLLIPNPRDIPGFIKELSKFKFNILPAVNTLFNALMNHPDFAKLDFSSLLVANGGGMAVQRAVAERWFKLTGRPIAEGYGLSETSPVATSNRVDTTEFTGTIGLPVPSTEISIRDDDAKPVPLGQPGEICIKGPQVMVGYWQRDDETAKVMTPDGFFKSGDIGIMDEQGFVRIVDRKKDMILVSGFNVYPNEVEAVVAMHPGVLEVAAVGVPDEKSGEAVKIFVVKKDPGLTTEALLAHCKENLAGYKIPKHVEFRTDLPKTNVGKILRRALRDGAN
ncbi:MAG: long-chain fatty acid--CoA ligase [Betaproteobacteria bacterium]|nr:long-chain fatty acid--CoA ligase [Betaproteobacteria bacterium]